MDNSVKINKVSGMKILRIKYILSSVFCVSLILLCSLANQVLAQNNNSGFNKTQLPLPRFVSLSSDEVNLRTGPNTKYPIKWILVKEGMPVEIIRQFDDWREIRDMSGDVGWVHKNLLSGMRMVVVTGRDVVVLYKKPDTETRPVVKLEPGVQAQILKCSKTWCRISVAGYKGWLQRQQVWGVYPQEIIED